MSYSTSHPLRMRGLKQLPDPPEIVAVLSHPLRMRGLKRRCLNLPTARYVASFTDAWIETHLKHFKGRHSGVASFTDAWIETARLQSIDIVNSVASFTDAWIETNRGMVTTGKFGSHPLRMRGLKLYPVDCLPRHARRILYGCVD